MTADPLPLPLGDAAEPRGLRPVRCRVCGRLLSGRVARLRGVGEECWAKLGGRMVPRPGGFVVEQEELPGM